jgi:hypothetical protein
MATQKVVSPHGLKLNDRVYQRLNPWNTGQVTDYEAGNRFTVTYDNPDRRPRQARERVTYGISQQDNFLVGNPPSVEATPAPVKVEAFGK